VQSLVAARPLANQIDTWPSGTPKARMAKVAKAIDAAFDDLSKARDLARKDDTTPSVSDDGVPDFLRRARLTCTDAGMDCR
jgi:hypothetical protein